MGKLVVSASKISTASRGREFFSVSAPAADEEKFGQIMDDLQNFLGDNFDDALTITINYGKVD